MSEVLDWGAKCEGVLKSSAIEMSAILIKYLKIKTCKKPVMNEISNFHRNRLFDS